MLSFANLGRSYQAYDVYSTPYWVVRKGRGCFLSQFRNWEVSCLPCWALSCSAVHADVRVGNPCHPHSPGSGQGCREAKELPKSRKFIKKRFTSGQKTAVVLLLWRRVSFTATACLLCHQHINVSHEYSGSTMKWLFLKTIVISKPMNYVKHYPAKRRAGKTLPFAAGLHGFWRLAGAGVGVCLSQVWRIKHLEIVPLVLVFHNCMSSVQLSPISKLQMSGRNISPWYLHFFTLIDKIGAASV